MFGSESPPEGDLHKGEPPAQRTILFGDADSGSRLYHLLLCLTCETAYSPSDLRTPPEIVELSAILCQLTSETTLEIVSEFHQFVVPSGRFPLKASMGHLSQPPTLAFLKQVGRELSVVLRELDFWLTEFLVRTVRARESQFLRSWRKEYGDLIPADTASVCPSVNNLLVTTAGDFEIDTLLRNCQYANIPFPRFLQRWCRLLTLQATFENAFEMNSLAELGQWASATELRTTFRPPTEAHAKKCLQDCRLIVKVVEKLLREGCPLVPTTSMIRHPASTPGDSYRKIRFDDVLHKLGKRREIMDSLGVSDDSETLKCSEFFNIIPERIIRYSQIFVVSKGSVPSVKHGYAVIDLSDERWSGLHPKNCGPCQLYDASTTASVESALHYTRVYRFFMTPDGEPSFRYFSWANEGWNGRVHERWEEFLAGCELQYHWWKGEKLSPLEFKHQVAVPLYLETVKKCSAFRDLVSVRRRKFGRIALTDSSIPEPLNSSCEDLLNSQDEGSKAAFDLLSCPSVILGAFLSNLELFPGQQESCQAFNSEEYASLTAKPVRNILIRPWRPEEVIEAYRKARARKS